VQFRAKDPDRLRAKLDKYLASGEHAAEFKDLESVFRVLKDLAGVRVTTYVEDDRVRVIALVCERFSGIGEHSQVVPEVKDQPSAYYRATHCMVRLKDQEAVGPNQNLKGLGCEVQVCSQLAHVYHELEHDLRYKPLSGALSKKESDLLNALARLMEVGDTIINQTRDAVEARQRKCLDEVAERPAAHPEGSLRDNPFLKVLADSPLLLDLASRVQSSRPQRDLPETPAHFYQDMVRLLAAGALLSGDSDSIPQPDADELLEALPGIAFRLFSRDAGASRYERTTLLETFIRATNCSQPDAANLLERVVERGLFVVSTHRSTEQQFEFAHATFRDFLAATHVASIANRDGWDDAEMETYRSESVRSIVKVSQLIDANAFEPDWQSFIVFVAGLMTEPLGLVQILADRKNDDHYRHRLGLLCRCYRALSASRQFDVASSMEFVFEEVLRIAKRCEHDDAGHRKPWLEWVEMLLPSEAGAERLCGGLLTLDGRYHGWAVSLKVLELFERALTRGNVSQSVVDAIAGLGMRDENQWGVNTARLALRLADDGHKQRLFSRFLTILESPETPDRVKIRLAEAVATAEDTTASKHAGEILIALAESNSLSFENNEKAVNGLVALLETSLAPTAAPLLVSHLLNPSSRHHFWLAWRIIGKAERDLDNPWLPVFLGVTLFADREDDRRLRLWSAQVLSTHSQPHLRELGLRMLLGMVQEKKSHSWVHAARWLVESGPAEVAEKARATLLAEASSSESGDQRVAIAELLEMGAIGPDGGPIRNAVREAVLMELEKHGENDGSRLQFTAPGAPRGNVDLELFADNPAAVIECLHTFNGPSFYLRDRGDPNEEERRMRHWNAKLLQGTRYWPEVVRSSIQAVNEGADPDRSGALSVVLFAASGSTLLDLLRETLKSRRLSAPTRHCLLEELCERGWRLRFIGRRVEVLRKGREDSHTVTEAAQHD
jgi:ppGpp synthetase/RelA/SpoT-type nucleotidyltranferase